MILVDTNVFLELMLNQKQAESCRQFLEAISSGRIEAVISRFSIHAIESAIRAPEVLTTFIVNIDNSTGMYVYETNNSDELAASLLMKETGLDFDDALKYFIAKKTGSSAIVSFDRHFDKMDLPRIIPGEALTRLIPGKSESNAKD